MYSKIICIRGKVQFSVLIVFACAVMLVLYKVAVSDVQTYPPPLNTKLPLPPRQSNLLVARRQNEMEDINEIAYMTQNPKNVQKQKNIEADIMSSIHKRLSQKKPEFVLNSGNNVAEMEGSRHYLNMGKPWAYRSGQWNGYVDNEESIDQVKKSARNEPQNLFPAHRIVHLDLKGAPPRIEYYRELFPFLQELGASGILLEYEDMFPFWGPIQNLAAKNAYTKQEIKKLLKFARDSKLEVIPLVPTFGHMEFVLKLVDFIDLREVPQYPQVICPTHNNTMHIIRMMIDQVMELHHEANWLHIGSDEVYNIGDCTRCQSYMIREGWTKAQLFLHHVSQVAKYVKRSYDIQPLMWDDEFRSVSESVIKDSGIAQHVEIVIWKYTSDILSQIPTDVWGKYSEIFNGVWIASAFKGATGSDQYITNINFHLDNHRAWMQIVHMYKDQITFKGIIFTGWQRYDHFATLCELLPGALPSLAVSLMYVQYGNADSHSLQKLIDLLQCDSLFPMDLEYIGFITHCNFPGGKVYENIQKLFILKQQINEMFDSSVVKGWMTDYNVNHDFSQPAHIEQATQELNRLKMELIYLERDMKLAMDSVYDKYMIAEWIETFLKPLHLKLEDFWVKKEKLLSRNHWPRRPLDMLINKDL